jgi:hypothetical protein
MTYHILFTPSQGTLMRILTQVTRRGIPLEEIRAVKGSVLLVLDVTEKQDGQLRRAWENQIDVTEVQVVS